MTWLTYLLQAGLILAVLTLCYQLLLRRAIWFGLNRYLLWLNIGLVLALPLVELPDFRPEPMRKLVRQAVPNWSRFNLTPTQSNVQRAARPTQEVSATATVPSSTHRSFNWMNLLLCIYGLGAAALTVRFAGQLLSLSRLIRRSERSWEDGIWLVSNDEVRSPFSFFRWVVLNPALYAPDEFDQILRHERVHCRQWHSLDMLLAEGLRIVFWFNPFAWWYQRLVQENLEYLVDREVLREGVERKTYQYYLLKACLSDESALAGSLRSITNSFNQPKLKLRIQMMNQPASSDGGSAYLIFCLLLAGCCLAFSSQRMASKYLVANRHGVFGLVTSVTTEQDLEIIQQAFANRGMDLRYQADADSSGLINYFSVEVRTDNRLILKAVRQIPPFVITALRTNDSKPFTVSGGRQTILLPDTLYSLWEHEKPVVALNGRVLNLGPGQPFGLGLDANVVKTRSLTAQEAVKRFGPVGRYGATTIDGKISNAIFSQKPEVMALGHQVLMGEPLTPNQLFQTTFLIDGQQATYERYQQLLPEDKVAVAIFDQESIHSLKFSLQTETLVAVTTQRQLLPKR